MSRDAELADPTAALTGMAYAALRAEWRRLFRSDAPKKLSRDLLALGVGWKVQERALGGVSAVTTRQLAELARTMETGTDLVKVRKVTLRPGAKIVRNWNGETHEVAVIENGFVWREQTWTSLSAIAREMTGTRWSGPRFFGLVTTSRSRKARGESAADA